MLNCQKCNFKILPKMRFSLVKNFCPSCGGTLLSELDSHEIGFINKKLQTQEFIVSLSEQLSKDLVQNLIYDLSIFIKFDLKKEMGMSTSISSEEKSLSFENPSVEGTEEQEEDAGGQKMPLKRIARISAIADRQQPAQARNLRRMSAADNEPEDEYGDDEDDLDEGLDERVKRLKNLYNTSPTLKKFQGITRSDES
jgi:hypothetical protein